MQEEEMISSFNTFAARYVQITVLGTQISNTNTIAQ